MSLIFLFTKIGHQLVTFLERHLPAKGRIRGTFMQNNVDLKMIQIHTSQIKHSWFFYFTKTITRR